MRDVRACGRWLLVLLVLGGLTGCSQVDWNKRYGPDPVLNADAVRVSVSNQKRILHALAYDYGVSYSARDGWYRVAEAGFNYVDDECKTYFNTLFFLDRHRERIKNALSAAAQTTDAILFATGATTKSMTVVAQAFGLSESLTDIVADTYLYKLPPGTTLGFVRELKLAYRKGAAARKAEISGPSEAYHQIQEYLSLCLPPVIETKLVEHIKAARAFPDPVTEGDGASFGLNLGSLPVVSRPQLEAAVTGAVVPEANQPPPRNQNKPTVDQAKQLFTRRVQSALCTNIDGGVGRLTRSAIHDYILGKVGKSIPVDQIDIFSDDIRVGYLNELISDVDSCKNLGFETAYEVAFFGVPKGARESRITDTQNKIEKLLSSKGVSLTISKKGAFNPETRNAIKELRKALALPPGETIDPALRAIINSVTL